MEEVDIRVEADIHPTESEDKVKRAIENIFGDLPLEIKDQSSHKVRLIGTRSQNSEPLTRLRNLLRREKIRDAARKALFEGLSGETISFCLNKQAAYAGHVSFSQEAGESPLGPIKVRLRSANPRRVIHELTSKDV